MLFAMESTIGRAQCRQYGEITPYRLTPIQNCELCSNFVLRNSGKTIKPGCRKANRNE
jgi:hypothetical protein